MHSRALLTMLTGISLVACGGIASAQDVSREVGSGDPYRTIVTRESEGELSQSDFRQATLLTSQVVMHLNDAVKLTADGTSERGRDVLAKARKLIEVVRELLPVTEITTRVVDRDGEEVYRHVARVQDDQIPIYTGTIAVEVIEPVVEAKKERAQMAGVKLGDADLLYSSVLVDLDYVERKLRRAEALLDEDATDALAQLALAQTAGVRFVVNRKDDPLMEAQLALRLAQRMAADGRAAATRNNLELAANHLEIYRSLLATGDQGEVRAIQRDLEALVTESAEPSTDEIRDLWQRVSALFEVTEGEMRPTTGDARAVEAAAAPER